MVACVDGPRASYPGSAIGSFTHGPTNFMLLDVQVGFFFMLDVFVFEVVSSWGYHDVDISFFVPGRTCGSAAAAPRLASSWICLSLLRKR